MSYQHWEVRYIFIQYITKEYNTVMDESNPLVAQYNSAPDSLAHHHPSPGRWRQCAIGVPINTQGNNSIFLAKWYEEEGSLEP